MAIQAGRAALAVVAGLTDAATAKTSLPACVDAAPVPVASPRSRPAYAVGLVAAIKRDVALHRDIETGRHQLLRPLTRAQEATLAARLYELAPACAPFNLADRNDVALAVGYLRRGLAGLPRSQAEEDAEAAWVESMAGSKDGHIRALLDEFPAWAIIEACRRIRLGKGEVFEEGDGRQPGHMRTLSNRFMPRDAEIAEVIERLATPLRDELASIELLLASPVRLPPPPKPPVCTYFPKHALEPSLLATLRQARGESIAGMREARYVQPVRGRSTSSRIKQTED